MKLVGGVARCCNCVQDRTECRVNTRAIIQGRTSVKAGRVTARAPTGTSCLRCNMSLHRLCDLPRTADLWEKVNAKRAMLATEKTKAEAEKKSAEVEEKKVASGSKQKSTEELGAAGRLK